MKTKLYKKVLIWVWCFPQMLAGFLVKTFTKAKPCGDHYKVEKLPGSVSLGEYIFLCPSHWNSVKTLNHEKGHQKQSLYLGWLYLIVIGLPSIIWAGCFGGFRKKYNVNYYAFYTEKWADKLGNVKR